jgi:hypothetical protein
MRRVNHARLLPIVACLAGIGASWGQRASAQPAPDPTTPGLQRDHEADDPPFAEPERHEPNGDPSTELPAEDEQPLPHPELRPPSEPITDPVGPYPYPPLGTANTRTHQGSFFQAVWGLGMHSAASGNVRYSGGGVFMYASAGHSIRRNLIFLFELQFSSVNEPRFWVDGRDLTGSSAVSTLTRAGFGPGVAYYFPSNLYASGSVTATSLGLEGSGQMTQTDFGVGVRGAFGKEWWVSANWGMGVGAHLHFGNLPGAPNGGRWTTVEGGLTCSFTYN